ncbi:unannotated protein [freshwater metagenome]|uniref:Unannotated protein n=1 Tax=freshwater metagenome TaxID=449393 RepID=A0A6J6MIL5_9ZZZZ
MSITYVLSPVLAAFAGADLPVFDRSFPIVFSVVIVGSISTQSTLKTAYGVKGKSWDLSDIGDTRQQKVNSK